MCQINLDRCKGHGSMIRFNLSSCRQWYWHTWQRILMWVLYWMRLLATTEALCHLEKLVSKLPRPLCAAAYWLNKYLIFSAHFCTFMKSLMTICKILRVCRCICKAGGNVQLLGASSSGSPAWGDCHCSQMCDRWRPMGAKSSQQGKSFELESRRRSSCPHQAKVIVDKKL